MTDSRRVVEEFTPYLRSGLWRIHDAYFRLRGAQAWTEDEIPFQMTSSYAVARQHAELVASLAAARDPAEPMWLLEVGSGLGVFAANFLEALAVDAPPGADPLARVRYAMSDCFEGTVREALEAAALARLRDRGCLIPARFDLRGHEPPVDLEGRPLPAAPALVFANYIACVAPTHFLRKVSDGWGEMYAEISTAEETASVDLDAILAECEAKGATGGLLARYDVRYVWRRTELDQLFADPLHARVIRRALAHLDEATLAYPFGFLEFLLRARPWLDERGVVLVSDFGYAQVVSGPGSPQPVPTLYGDSLNHGVQFAVFDAFAAETGWDVARTTLEWSPLSHALLSPRPIPAAWKQAFERAFVDRHDGTDLLDYEAAARLLQKEGDHTRAARFFARALELHPTSAELHYELGRACVVAGLPEKGMPYLVAGSRLEGAEGFDWDLQLAVGHHRLREPELAIQAYQRSIDRHPDRTTALVGLAMLYRDLGEPERATRALTQALERDPQCKPALALLAGDA